MIHLDILFYILINEIIMFYVFNQMTFI